MTKQRAALGVLGAGVLVSGLVAGALTNATPSFAAAKTHTHAAHTKATTKAKTSTTAKKQGSKATGTQTATRHADGQITAVNGDTITMKPDADPAGSNEYTGVTTIVLSSATKYGAGHNSTPTTTRPTFAAGQFIVAEGTVSSDGKTLNATLVSVGNGGHGGHGGHGQGGPHADGTVTGVNGDSVSVKPDNDPAGSNEYTKVTTIVLTSSTQYGGGRGQAATTTRPTITAGEFIVAEGTLSSDGAILTATKVSLRPSAPGGH